MSIADESFADESLRDKLKRYLAENEVNFIVHNLQSYFIDLLSKKKKTIYDVAERGCLGASNLAKIYEGARSAPKRNTAIKICFGLELDLDETQELLQYCEMGRLNPRIRRDSIIRFCIDNHTDAKTCDEMLTGEHERGIV